MQLVFPDDEAVQPHLKLLAMAKRWKKVQDEVTAPATEPETNEEMAEAAGDENVPLPEARIDDEEMNDES